MTDHLRRIREHWKVETEALRLEGERARLFDHRGSRGSEAEQSLLRWIRTRLAPDFTISSGEIIDSFDTNAEKPSRQQDGIVHRNDRNANRFLLPSGLRLVPVESVAALIEIKLTLGRTEFASADEAATLTSNLRLRLGNYAQVPMEPILNRREYHSTFRSFLSEEHDHGLPLRDESLRANRIAFSVFGFGGVERQEILIDMVKKAETVNLVCCLGAGCVARMPDGTLEAVGAENALAMFADHIGRCVVRYDSLAHYLGSSFDGYAGYQPTRITPSSSSTNESSD